MISYLLSSAVCQDRTYGENCAESCGSCSNNDSCDTKTGHCNDCAAGYMKDDFCKTGTSFSFTQR